MPTVKISVVAPLSGETAQFGNDIRNGLELAAADINSHGGIASLGGARAELALNDEVRRSYLAYRRIP